MPDYQPESQAEVDRREWRAARETKKFRSELEARRAQVAEALMKACRISSDPLVRGHASEQAHLDKTIKDLGGK